jgi:nucleoid-associated protein YgaU
MDRLDELKQKYASVLTAVREQGVQLAHLHVQDNKLFMQGKAPSEAAKNAVWSQIKAVNPAYDDITVDITVNASVPQPGWQPTPAISSRRIYTVQAGDSLSKIAQHFYGNAGDYMRIFDANKDKLRDPNRVEIGQQLVIPANR